MEKLIGAAILMICRVVSCTWNAVFLDKVLIKGAAKLQVPCYKLQGLIRGYPATWNLQPETWNFFSIIATFDNYAKGKL